MLPHLLSSKLESRRKTWLDSRSHTKLSTENMETAFLVLLELTASGSVGRKVSRGLKNETHISFLWDLPRGGLLA